MCSKLFTFLFVSSIVIALALPLLLFHSPSGSNYAEAESKFYKKYVKALSENTNERNRISVMSFNVRLDAQEQDPNNHFTKRVFRLSDTIQKWQPSIIGMQEPFGGQVEHLMSVVNVKTDAEVNARKKREGFHEENVHVNDPIIHMTQNQPRVHYKALGYNRTGFGPDDRTHPVRHTDFFAGILYRPDHLQLLEQGYIWLTESTTENRRVGNIARFRVKNKKRADGDDNNPPLTEIIHFNTHLCVRSEFERRKQSAVLINEIARWKRKYPHAILFLTGDFNSAPGHSSHRTLLGEEGHFQYPSFNVNFNKDLDINGDEKKFISTSEERSTLLFDTWETCALESNCEVGTDTALTFNGWLPATWVDSYLARMFGRLAFTLHAMQLRLPIAPPSNWKQVLRIVKDFFTVAPSYSISESLPKYWSRLHVDWILHDQKLAQPEMFHVADARDEKLSSDHFPVIGVFKI